MTLCSAALQSVFAGFVCVCVCVLALTAEGDIVEQ